MELEDPGARPESKEASRLQRHRWRKWGPYLSERQWGTVREDYSEYGSFWDYFTHDKARSRAYRWGEDGIAGISDEKQLLCLSVALWNRADPFLKERLFGLSNSEGSHGEDVKELYYYLDAVPSHAYLKMLYKYPQAAFPYEQLRQLNSVRLNPRGEYEILDTGVFDEDRYFDVYVEYGKVTPDDILMLITVHNRGPQQATLNVLPQIWFRNTWSWREERVKPVLLRAWGGVIAARHPQLEDYYLYAEGEPEFLFCENETNFHRVHGMPAGTGYFKDGIHDYITRGEIDAVNPGRTGTKAALNYLLSIPPGDSRKVRLRLANARTHDPFGQFDETMQQRRHEADAFYAAIHREAMSTDARLIQRQALAGMIWNKQFYKYDVWEWLTGDPTQPKPPRRRLTGRNTGWQHLHNADIISMPDKWEFPWYAAWDLAFHCIALAMVDPAFAKEQLVLLTQEHYMHPNGQLPAYEAAFDAVNPPVHAWAAWRVYQAEKETNHGKGDTQFLERLFHKLMLNFTWWVNRKDELGLNIFQGGFLGLDNIGVFDRGASLPSGGTLNQADATSWMAMYALDMMKIALELAQHNPVYEEIAVKFFQHFLHIAKAMNDIGASGVGLWDDEDEFYYDVLYQPERGARLLKIRSIVGLIPLFAVATIEPETIRSMPYFARSMEKLRQRRPDLVKHVSHWMEPGKGRRHLLSLVFGTRVKSLLRRMLDESEFLSAYGVRGLSKYHEKHPYVLDYEGRTMSVSYAPGEADTDYFGANSNWRGPIWMPINYMIIESLLEYYRFYGDDFRIECPTHSNRYATLDEVAGELRSRLIRVFARDQDGHRPIFGHYEKLQNNRYFRDNLLFYECFHGDLGCGVGASHQTGWTGLIANLLDQHYSPRVPKGVESQ